tara:strand:- start:365 stop:727 length:363 start_codon:yes stop_codon:yes gene_type:complete
MNEEAGYEATPFLPSWDTRITYLLCGKDGQHFRFVIYTKDRNTERFMMGFTESVVDTVTHKARERWNELIKEGWILKDIETAKNSPAMSKQMKDNMAEYLDNNSWKKDFDALGVDYALDA